MYHTRNGRKSRIFTAKTFPRLFGSETSAIKSMIVGEGALKIQPLQVICDEAESDYFIVSSCSVGQVKYVLVPEQRQKTFLIKPVREKLADRKN